MTSSDGDIYKWGHDSIAEMGPTPGAAQALEESCPPVLGC